MLCDVLFIVCRLTEPKLKTEHELNHINIFEKKKHESGKLYKHSTIF